MEIKKYAAIDIGSNAIRLLINNVIIRKEEEVQFKKCAFVRVPIRLGADTFIKGVISPENIDRIIDALNAFKLLMKVHKVEKYRACATSAMREASNSEAVVVEILKKTGIQIDLIDGKTEAKIIFSTDLSGFIKKDHSYLYVDVGGGSSEFTVFSNGKIINAKSFKIGTVRLLNKRFNKKKIWKSVKKWVKENTKGLKHVTLIGSGGNINKIYKMSGKPPGKSLSYVYLKAHYIFLKKMSYKDRVSKLGLNPDRADVIVPASKIYLNAMKWSNSTEIFVPKISLSDGIIKILHQNQYRPK